MKKINMRWMLGAALAGAIALPGCGGTAGNTNIAGAQTKTAEEYVQAAADALQSAESFEANFTAEISMDGSGEISTGAKVTIQREPLQARVDIQHDFGDASQASNIYLEEKDDAVNLYMNYDKQWTEMTLSPEDAMNHIRIYNTPKAIS